jgi:hypothetical protein
MREFNVFVCLFITSLLSLSNLASAHERKFNVFRCSGKVLRARNFLSILRKRSLENWRFLAESKMRQRENEKLIMFASHSLGGNLHFKSSLHNFTRAKTLKRNYKQKFHLVDSLSEIYAIMLIAAWREEKKALTLICCVGNCVVFKSWKFQIKLCFR